ALLPGIARRPGAAAPTRAWRSARTVAHARRTLRPVLAALRRARSHSGRGGTRDARRRMGRAGIRRNARRLRPLSLRPGRGASRHADHDRLGYARPPAALLAPGAPRASHSPLGDARLTRDRPRPFLR